MMLAKAPVVFLGKAFAERLPLKAIHYGASVLFVVLDVMFIFRAIHSCALARCAPGRCAQIGTLRDGEMIRHVIGGSGAVGAAR